MKKRERRRVEEKERGMHEPQHSVAASDIGASAIALVVATRGRSCERSRAFNKVLRFFSTSLLMLVGGGSTVYVRRECLTAAMESHAGLHTKPTFPPISGAIFPTALPPLFSTQLEAAAAASLRCSCFIPRALSSPRILWLFSCSPHSLFLSLFIFILFFLSPFSLSFSLS